MNTKRDKNILTLFGTCDIIFQQFFRDIKIFLGGHLTWLFLILFVIFDFDFVELNFNKNCMTFRWRIICLKNTILISRECRIN